MKTQCKSYPTLHYWKSPTNLPAYLAYKVKNKLHPGTMATEDSHLEMLCTRPIGCILLVIQDVSSNDCPPIITLVAAPSMATISAPLCGWTNHPSIFGSTTKSINHQECKTAIETLTSKVRYKQFAAHYNRTIKHIHSDNVIFAKTAFVNKSCQAEQQKHMFCGVGTH
jgi:hypothetical protein